MGETRQITRLSGKGDLAKLTEKDVVVFGTWREECIRQDIPGLRQGELLFISRLKYTGALRYGAIGVIYGHIDNLKVQGDGGFNLDFRAITTTPPQRTPDGKFYYGVNFIVKEIKDPKDKGYFTEDPEAYERFDRALREAES